MVAIGAAAVFAVAGRADDPRFDPPEASLQPSFVDAGGDVLYKARWHYLDNQRLTHATVEITIPAGWTLVASDPSGCTQTGTTVSCEWGTLEFDAVVDQEVQLTTGTALGTADVTSRLTFYEGPRNPGRRNQEPAPLRQTEVISADPTVTPDQAGDCVEGNFSVETVPGSGDSETKATAPATGELCTPISIKESPRQGPPVFCQPNRLCVTEVVTTDAAAVPAATPIELKIVFRGTGLNTLPLIFTSAIGRFAVEECPDDAVAAPDPCWSDQVTRQQSATWFVNWTGVDPTWES